MDSSRILSRLAAKGIRATNLEGGTSDNYIVKLNSDGVVDPSLFPGTSAISHITGNLTIDGNTTVGGTFGVTGTVSLPSATSIGSVSSTELGYLDGVTSAVQTQLNTHTSSLSSHASDATVHITSGQNTFLDGITVPFAKVNFLSTLSSDVQIQLDARQPLDATLTALAGVSTAANKLIYASGSDAFTTTDLSVFARTILDDADAPSARTTLGVGSTGKIVWVDTTNGNDSTAAVYRMDKPYLTLAAAKTAASSGDTINVLPGSYSISGSIAKNGVNWFFYPGTTVTYSENTTSIGIFDDGGSAMTFTVFGLGSFVRTTTSSSLLHGVIKCSHASSNISVYAKNITSNSPAQSSAVRHEGGILRVIAENIVGTNVSYAVWWINGQGYVKANSIISDGITVYVTCDETLTGTFFVEADYILGAISSIGANLAAAAWIKVGVLKALESGTGLDNQAIHFEGGNKLYVTAQKIYGEIYSLSGFPASYLYVTTDKHVPVENGDGNLIHITANVVRVKATHLDPEIWTGNPIVVSNGELQLIGGELTGGGGTGGMLISGGIVKLENFRLDTSLNSAIDAITISGGALILDASTVIISESAASSLAATSGTNTVYSYGAWSNTAHEPTHVTIVGTYNVNAAII